MLSEQTPPPNRPTTDQLAGVYVYLEGEEKVMLPPADGKSVVETPPEFRCPTIEQLAGINVRIEAEEKLVFPKDPPSGEGS